MCLALTTLMVRDVETGVALPVINYDVRGIIPLNIPNCFKNGTPFLDCQINYEPFWPGNASLEHDYSQYLKRVGVAIDRGVSRAAPDLHRLRYLRKNLFEKALFL